MAMGAQEQAPSEDHGTDPRLALLGAEMETAHGFTVMMLGPLGRWRLPPNGLGIERSCELGHQAETPSTSRVS